MSKSEGRSNAPNRGRKPVTVGVIILLALSCLKIYLKQHPTQIEVPVQTAEKRSAPAEATNSAVTIDFTSAMGGELVDLIVTGERDPEHRPADWEERADQLTGPYKAQIDQFRMVERMRTGVDELDVLERLRKEPLPFTAYLIAVVYDYWGEHLEDEALLAGVAFPKDAEAKYLCALDWYHKASVQLANLREMRARAFYHRAAVNLSLAENDPNPRTSNASLDECIQDCDNGLSIYRMHIGFGTKAGALCLQGRFAEMDDVLRVGLHCKAAEQRNPNYLMDYVLSPPAQQKEFAPAVKHFSNWVEHVKALKAGLLPVAPAPMDKQNRTLTKELAMIEIPHMH